MGRAYFEYVKQGSKFNGTVKIINNKWNNNESRSVAKNFRRFKIIFLFIK